LWAVWGYYVEGWAKKEKRVGRAEIIYKRKLEGKKKKAVGRTVEPTYRRSSKEMGQFFPIYQKAK